MKTLAIGSCEMNRVAPERIADIVAAMYEAGMEYTDGNGSVTFNIKIVMLIEEAPTPPDSPQPTDLE